MTCPGDRGFNGVLYYISISGVKVPQRLFSDGAYSRVALSSSKYRV